jgi:hypothetical protein
MRPLQTSITPLRFCILAIRLMALLMLFSSLYYLGHIIYELVSNGPWRETVVGPEAATLLVYAIVLMIFVRYPAPIARAISKGLPRFVVRSRWTRVDLLAAIIASVAVYEMLAALPLFLNQLYGILTRYEGMIGEGAPEKARFNLLVFGFVATILRMAVSGIVFIRGGTIAQFWDRWQTAGGLKIQRTPRG